jgi:hypothetical protein
VQSAIKSYEQAHQVLTLFDSDHASHPDIFLRLGACHLSSAIYQRDMLSRRVDLEKARQFYLQGSNLLDQGDERTRFVENELRKVDQLWHDSSEVV